MQNHQNARIYRPTIAPSPHARDPRIKKLMKNLPFIVCKIKKSPSPPDPHEKNPLDWIISLYRGAASSIATLQGGSKYL
jgi:hypothetical protein